MPPVSVGPWCRKVWQHQPGVLLYSWRRVLANSDHLLTGILRTLRSTLSACAETSGSEGLTAHIVANFLALYRPDLLRTNLGGCGVAAVFEGETPGATVLVRCELDGLALEDGQQNPEGFAPQASHRCGHDGHMVAVAGLAPLLSQRRPSRGRVVLLFQPAEETGQGARLVLDDPAFEAFHPDFALALHNLPGYPFGAVVCRSGIFASASVGMRVELHGQPAHAAHPESAKPPTFALGELLVALPALSAAATPPHRMLTITHATMGREAFGITPGEGLLCATLRSASSEDLALFEGEAERMVCEIARARDLSPHITWVERFPATRNDPELVAQLERCAHRFGLTVEQKATPFRWSDDFGYFANVCPSLYFGLGIGEDAPGLHQLDYRFPDAIIPTAVTIFSTMVENLLTGDRGSGFQQ